MTTRGLLAAAMALLVNDVVCLALTLLVIHLARRMGLDPQLHLIGLAITTLALSAGWLWLATY